MDHVVTFLKQGSLPKDKCEAKKVHRNAPRYWLSEKKKLYKRSYSEPYLFCVHLKQWSSCWKSYMKAYMGVIQGVGLWRIGPSPKGTGGLACKKPLRIM